MRLDQFISKKYWVTRNRAQFFIKMWKVKLENKLINKSSFFISEDFSDSLEIDFSDINYVSRSALKLKWFFSSISLDISWFYCLDVGASTWGFTQILLEKWAEKLISLDVWNSQLHDILLSDSRVQSIENTDIRDFKTDTNLDLIVVDVSFISLRKIVLDLKRLMSKNTYLIMLFKPQFEVWVNNMKKNWLVKNEKIAQSFLKDFELFLWTIWLNVLKVSKSELDWEKGNSEYFIYCRKVWKNLL